MPKTLLLLKTFILSVAALLLWMGMISSCNSSTMKTPDNLQDWLDQQFPNQFEVLRSLRDIHPKNFYLNKHTAIVGSKSDPVVQFEIVWYKDKPDLGISKEEVQTLVDTNTRDANLAREWYSRLTKNGLDRISVGVIDMALYVLPYGEPNPANRLKIVDIVFNTIKEKGDTTQTSIWIEAMEDTAYRKEIQEIIPFGYWRRKDTYHEDQKIMSLDFEFSSGQDVQELNEHWTFNSSSLRSLQFIEEAYKEAAVWADKHLKKPYYLEPIQYVEFESLEEEPFSVRYSFPYYTAQPDSSETQGQIEPLGFVTCVYDTEKRTVRAVQKRED